jgi:hypothetical protein
MTTEKLTEIVSKVQITLPEMTSTQVEEFINADWPNSEEHSKWLETATAEEISDWIITCQL